MNLLEKKMAAVLQLLTAESDSEREAARKEILKLMGSEHLTDSAKDTEDIAREILLELGAPDQLIGHPYTIQAILLAANNRMYIDNITSGLYRQLAAQFNTTAARVERAIRHLIEVTWSRGDMDVLNHYFGNTVSAEKGKPTNGEFVARLANVVNLRVKNAERNI